jgi:secondary thiamine-phosphate synthase enzyme
MRTHTSYRTFRTAKRQEIIDITDDVEACRAAAGIDDGFVLVSAMHISASVFVNDHEPGLWADILEWLETRIAPWDPAAYRHNAGTGEDNAAAHLRSLTIGHEVIVPVTKGGLTSVPGSGCSTESGTANGPSGWCSRPWERLVRPACEPFTVNRDP